MEMNQRVKEQLILNNLPLVSFVLKRYYQPGQYDWEELEAEGTLGLVKAAHNFDTGAGTAFSTYAATCIRNQIFMYFRSNNRYLKMKSLDEEIPLKENFVTLGELVADPDDKIERLEDTMLLIDLLSSSKEKELVCDYYGLSGSPMTQIEMASNYGISQSYLSRKIKKAVCNMRQHAV